MYMYSELRSAIMNQSGNGKTVPKDWTPNSIKAIYIMRTFILVAYHVKQPKLVQLNIEEALEDIQRNGSNGALHNLLSQKQLSCLEEIYVDSIFNNYKGLMNLEGYVSSLVNSVSRLRYYGYADFVDANEVVQCYARAQITRELDYTYALDKSRTCTLMYQSTENNNWYSKYNLRPDKYQSDVPKGNLSLWFKLVESKIVEGKQAEIETLRSKGINSAVVALFNQDMDYAENIKNFLLLRKRLAKLDVDAITHSVLSAIEYVDIEKSVTKISAKQLQGILKEAGISISGKGSFILQAYQKSFSVFTRENVNLDLERLVESAKSYEGLIGFPSYLCNICCKLAEKSKNSANDTYLMLYMVMSNMGLLQSETDLLKVIHEIKNSASCVDSYMGILLGVCGCTSQTIKGVE